MKVAMIANSNHNVNSGVSGTRLAIAESLRQLGVHVDTFFMDDFKMFNGGIVDKIVFPWRLAARFSKWKDYDLLDIASGDSWVLSYFRNRPVIVSSSHGLEHLAHREILEEHRLGNLHLSKKYYIYWGGYRIWEVSKSFKRADFSIVLNSEDKQFVKDQIGKDSYKIRSIFNGIPSYFLNLPVNDIETEKNEVIRIAQVGSYIHRKGISYSTRALNAILAKYDHVEIAFMGTGCAEEKVLADFDPDVRNRVKAIPTYNHSELPQLLRGYHIKLFPTLSEGFGKTLVECMACGLAPITTDTAGPSDIVTNGVNALVIPKRSIEQMVVAIEKLINDPCLLKQLRINAYRTAQEFTWDNAARNRLVCYEQAIQDTKKYPEMIYERK